MTKIFFADLDGTLLNDKKELTVGVRAALDEYMDAGNYLSICTGRSIASASRVCREFDMSWDRMYLSCFNGGVIYDRARDEVIHRVVMDIDDVVDIFKMFRDAGIACQTYSDEHILTCEDTEGFRRYISLEDDPYRIVGPDIRAGMPYAPCKVLGIELHDMEAFDQMRKDIENRYKGKYYCMYSEYCYLEVVPQASGKGTAVTALCNILDIPVKNAMAAGDQENDISMIQVAGLGVAMINGVESAKKAADYVTERDNNHDGLVDIIRKFTSD